MVTTRFRNGFDFAPDTTAIDFAMMGVSDLTTHWCSITEPY